MSFKFNLFPTQPQKSYYPKGQRDSTSNSYYQQRVTNRTVTNEYQLLKASGKANASAFFQPAQVATANWGTPAAGAADFIFYGYWFTGDPPTFPNTPYGSLSNDIVPLINNSNYNTSPVGIDTIGYQRGGFWNEAFYIQFLPGWTTGLSENSISSIAFYNELGEKVREYSTANLEPGQFALSAGETEYYWWWPASDNTDAGAGGTPAATNSPYTMAEEQAFWSAAVGQKLTVVWNIVDRQNSTPQMYKRYGSSKTYNDGTGSRLLKLKANAINGSNKRNK